MRASAALAALFWIAAQAVPVADNKSRCTSVSFRTAIDADTLIYGDQPDRNNATAVKAYLLNALDQGPKVEGIRHFNDTLTISGTFCSPPAGVRSKDTLQILVHGLNYEKSSWGGFGLSDKYDWHRFAGSRGYSTLAIDRIGRGASDKPDAFDVIQGSVHISSLQKIFSAAKAGTLSPLPAFKRVVYVGHSYGSLLATHLVIAHPGTVDALILTGFSVDIVPSRAMIGDLWSAAEVSPRFAKLPLGHLVQRTESTFTEVFFTGAFDPVVAHRNFEKIEPVAIGEFISPALLPPQNSTGFTGPVFVATGDEDVLFCNAGPTGCTQTLRNTGTKLFPSASKYDFLAVPKTGHSLTFHHSAPATLKKIHDWLDRAF